MRTAPAPVLRALLFLAAVMTAAAPCGVLAEGAARAETATARAEAPADLQGWAAQQSALCAEAIAAAERKWEIPTGLLLTMAKVESGRPLPPAGRLGPWPWTTDADAQGAFYDSKAGAIEGVRAALARGARYVDVGCVQVNLQYHPSAFRNLDEAFDPVMNADYAGRYLRGLRDGAAGGNWYVAVGYYHSQTPERAALYRERVTAVAEGRPMPRGMEVPLFQRAIQRGSIRLQLAGGGMLLVVRRQPSLRPQRRSPCEIARVLGDYLASKPRGCAR